MVAKLIVWDVDREAATARMLRALGEYEISPLRTLIPFHRAILATEQWRAGETCRDLIGDRSWLKSLAAPPPSKAAESPEGEDAVAQREYKVEVNGRLHSVKVIGATPDGQPTAGAVKRPPQRERARRGASGAASETLPSPLQGTVLKVAVAKGADVEEGALVCVIEAMKMENEITAHRSGKVTELNVAEGAAISSGEQICKIE
jgi:acetyl-CoA/propionyl-CoA carboxylase biotin carboxyl carrier protein